MRVRAAYFLVQLLSCGAHADVVVRIVDVADGCSLESEVHYGAVEVILRARLHSAGQ